MKPEKMKSLWSKSDVQLPKICKIYFCSFFFWILYDLFHNFSVQRCQPNLIFSWQYVKLCQIRKTDTPKILPMWVFVAQKCQQNVEILHLVWTLTPNKFWTKCLRCLIFTQKQYSTHILWKSPLQYPSVCNGCSNLLKISANWICWQL